MQTTSYLNVQSAPGASLETPVGCLHHKLPHPKDSSWEDVKTSHLGQEQLELPASGGRVQLEHTIPVWIFSVP